MRGSYVKFSSYLENLRLSTCIHIRSDCEAWGEADEETRKAGGYCLQLVSDRRSLAFRTSTSEAARGPPSRKVERYDPLERPGDVFASQLQPAAACGAASPSESPLVPDQRTQQR